MTFEVHQGGADAAADAAAWVVRLSADGADFAEFEAFEAWMAAAPGRSDAYDRALAAWVSIPQVAPAAVERHSGRGERFRRFKGPAWGAGVAAAAAAVVFMAPFTPAQTYDTAAGQHRDVTLADGSRVALNADTQMSVRLSGARRDVSLPRGEAAFDVAKDASRPFLIHIGPRSVRVVGTEFDVKAQGDALAVTVRRGVVEVRARDGAPPVRLTKGDQLTFAQADAPPRVSRTDPDAAFAWRENRLVYRQATIGQVVVALNARFGPPAISVDEAAAALPFSGVLVLDSREQVVRRLTMAEPLSARTTRSGIVLSMDKKQPN